MNCTYEYLMYYLLNEYTSRNERHDLFKFRVFLIFNLCYVSSVYCWCKFRSIGCKSYTSL